MNRKRWAYLLIAVFFISMMATLSCTKTPEDVRAWLKDKRAPTKMAEFIEKNNSLDVKIEAVMVLIERGQGDKIPDAMKSLDADERNQIVEKVVTRLDSLLSSDNETSQMRAKDGAYYLRRLELSEGNVKPLNQLMLRWIEMGDNFFRPIDRVGRVEQKRIFETVGADALPVYLRKFEALFAELNEQGPDPRNSLDVQKRMQTALRDLDGLKVENANDALAQLFVDNFNKAYPNVADIYSVPFMSNNSPLLIPVANRIMSDPDYKNNYLNNLRDIVVNNYYKTVQTKEGIEVCSKIIVDDKSGFLRWMCVDLLTQKLGKDSVEQILTSLPNSQKEIEIPSDHPLASTFKKGEFTWFEFESYCRSLSFNLNNQVPLEIFRKHASQGREVERIVSMICLSFNGALSDMQFLEALKSDRTDIRAWETNAKTLGEFAGVSASLFEERHKKRDTDAQKAAEQGAENQAGGVE